MSLKNNYLKQKSLASKAIVNTVERFLADKDNRIGDFSKNIRNLNEIKSNTYIKVCVIDTIEVLLEKDKSKVPDKKYKAINQALFFCANKPEYSNNRLMQSLFKSGFTSEQRDKVVILLDLIKSSGDKTSRIETSKKILGQFVRERSSRLNPEEIENIVLAGGGAKGFSLAKIPKALEDGGAKNLKRIAGTSAGAILGSMMALGYNSTELEDIVMNNQFGLFTKNSRLSSALLDPLTQNATLNVLKPFSDNAYASEFHKLIISELISKAAFDGIEFPHDIQNDIRHFYEKNIDVEPSADIDMKNRTQSSINKSIISNRTKMMGVLFDKVIEPIIKSKKGGDWIEDVLINKMSEGDKRGAVELATRMTEMSKPDENRLFHQLYPTTEQAVRFAIREYRGQDLIVGFFEDLIEAKVSKLSKEELSIAFYGDENPKEVSSAQIRRISFEQLKRLHDMKPDKFKEFFCTIAVKRPLKERVTGLMTGNYNRYKHHDVSHEHPELAQMAVADAVRVSMNLPGIYASYPFEVNGKEYFGADGGVISNLSIQVFDNHHAPEKTMCVIYASDKKMQQAENIYQLLIHPRSKGEINREIILVRGEITELTDRRQKLSKMIYNQRSKIENTDVKLREKMIGGAENRMGSLETKINDLRFRRQVLEHELKNTSMRSVLPVSVADSLAKKRHRGQYLPQDLNRTVLINTGTVNTLDFKLNGQMKRELMMNGEGAVFDVLSGRDDLELHFLRAKCEGYEFELAMDKIMIIENYIRSNKVPDKNYIDTITHVFQHALPKIMNKEQRNLVVDRLNDSIYKEHKKPNKALSVARSAWKEAIMSNPFEESFQI